MMHQLQWQSMVGRKIVQRSTEIVASYATISSCYGGGEGNTANVTTRRPTSKGFRHVSTSFLEFQTVYQWVPILQADSSGRWNMVVL